MEYLERAGWRIGGWSTNIALDAQTNQNFIILGPPPSHVIASDDFLIPTILYAQLEILIFYIHLLSFSSTLNSLNVIPLFCTY